MNELIIYCIDPNELTEFESVNRGFRSDIYVRIKDQYYHVYIYDIVRLKQDFESEIEYYGFFSVDPNLIIVKEASIIIVKETITSLYIQKYFERIKPVLKEEINKITLTQI